MVTGIRVISVFILSILYQVALSSVVEAMNHHDDMALHDDSQSLPTTGKYTVLGIKSSSVAARRGGTRRSEITSKEGSGEYFVRVPVQQLGEQDPSPLSEIPPDSQSVLPPSSHAENFSLIRGHVSVNERDLEEGAMRPAIYSSSPPQSFTTAEKKDNVNRPKRTTRSTSLIMNERNSNPPKGRSGEFVLRNSSSSERRSSSAKREELAKRSRSSSITSHWLLNRWANEEPISKATQQELALKEFNLGFIYFRSAADKGMREAQLLFANLCKNGLGVTQNYAEAFKYYKLAAEQGDPQAQHELAELYANGQGVPQNTEEMLYWTELAAERGIAASQYRLGFVYWQPIGPSRNLAKAIKWFYLAKQGGHPGAQEALDRVEREMRELPNQKKKESQKSDDFQESDD